jgi:GNAT superfamily N-acetyltransferase
LAVARRHRFHAAVSGLSKALVHSLTHIDYLERMGFVVTVQQDGEERVIADACYAVIDAGETAEFAIAVADDWRGLGLGRQLMAALERAAHGAGLRWLHGEVLVENVAMLGLMQRLDFCLADHPQDPTLVRVERRVGAPRQGETPGAADPGGQPWRRAWRRWLRPHALH